MIPPSKRHYVIVVTNPHHDRNHLDDPIQISQNILFFMYTCTVCVAVCVGGMASSSAQLSSYLPFSSVVARGPYKPELSVC